MSAVVSIVDELLTALAAPTPEQDQELIDLGVPVDTTHFVGAAKIQPSDGLYEPDYSDGMPSWIIPCFWDGATIDLLALTTDPVRWWLRLGLAAYLGGDCLHRLVMNEPLLIFANPLGWLRAEAPVNGCVILDWQLAARDIPPVPIIADCVALAEKLDRCLSIAAHVPDVRVPRAA